MSNTKLFSPKILVGLFLTFVLSAGLAYAIVPSDGGSLLSPTANIPESEKTGAGFGQFAGEPVTEACPLN